MRDCHLHLLLLRSLLEIAGLLFTAVTEGLVGPANLPSCINELTCSLAGRRCTLLTMLTSSTVTFFLISFYYPKITVFHKFLVFFANLPTTTANTLIVLFTLCVFPTCLSSVTIGLFTSLSCLGEVVSPLMIDYLPFVTGSQEGAFFILGLTAALGLPPSPRHS